MYVRLLTSPDLAPQEHAGLGRLFDEAFAGDFDLDDWHHALGGWHVVVGERDEILAHAAVVPRRLQVGERAVAAGYVEAVAVRPTHQRIGLGTAAMARIGDLVRARFELGALSTDAWPFYARLGWERWRGPSWVRHGDGRLVRTADEDEGLMILRSSATLDLDLSLPLTCDARDGDDW